MYVAQFNISRERYPLDHPTMHDFVDALAPINALADVTDGFVWRLHDESGNATAIRVFEDPAIVFNLSVWTTVASLKEFAYQSGHADVLRKRRKWFLPIAESSYVLWWVMEHERPSIDEAKRRLRHLRQHGPSDNAFTFDRSSGAAGSDG